MPLLLTFKKVQTILLLFLLVQTIIAEPEEKEEDNDEDILETPAPAMSTWEACVHQENLEKYFIS